MQFTAPNIRNTISLNNSITDKTREIPRKYGGICVPILKLPVAIITATSCLKMSKSLVNIVKITDPDAVIGWMAINSILAIVVQYFDAGTGSGSSSDSSVFFSYMINTKNVAVAMDIWNYPPLGFERTNFEIYAGAYLSSFVDICGTMRRMIQRVAGYAINENYVESHWDATTQFPIITAAALDTVAIPGAFGNTCRALCVACKNTCGIGAAVSGYVLFRVEVLLNEKLRPQIDDALAYYNAHMWKIIAVVNEDIECERAQNDAKAVLARANISVAEIINRYPGEQRNCAMVSAVHTKMHYGRPIIFYETNKAAIALINSAMAGLGKRAIAVYVDEIFTVNSAPSRFQTLGAKVIFS